MQELEFIHALTNAYFYKIKEDLIRLLYTLTG